MPLVLAVPLFCSPPGEFDLGTCDQCSDSSLVFIPTILKLFGLYECDNSA